MGMKKEKDIGADYITESGYGTHKKCGKKTLFVWQYFRSIKDGFQKTQNYVNVCDHCGSHVDESDLRSLSKNIAPKSKRVKMIEAPHLF